MRKLSFEFILEIVYLRSFVKHFTHCFIRYPGNFKGDVVCSLRSG